MSHPNDLSALFEAARGQASPSAADWETLTERLQPMLRPSPEVPGHQGRPDPLSDGEQDNPEVSHPELGEHGGLDSALTHAGSGAVTSKALLTTLVVGIGALIGVVASSNWTQPSPPAPASASLSSHQEATLTSPPALDATSSARTGDAPATVPGVATTPLAEREDHAGPTSVAVRPQNSRTLEPGLSQSAAPAAKPPVSPAAAKARPRPPTAPAVRSPANSLEDELRQLRPVETALRRGEAQRALQLLQHVSVRRLQSHRAALMAIATCRTGQLQRGRQLARVFTDKWPRSAFSLRVATACGSTPKARGWSDD